MSEILLGINTGFAVNRYPSATEWLRVVSAAGLNRVQITADMIDPRSPTDFIESEVETILQASSNGGPTITSAFTGAMTRLNLFGHPNQAMREFWLGWYRQFIDIAARLGALSVGGHLSILSIKDDTDVESRRNRLDHIMKCWVELSHYAADRGISCMIWEPMSISREFGETLDSAQQIQDKFDAATLGCEIKMCLDVDHGDIASTDPADTDPYAWLSKFAGSTHCIHMKQSLANKGGHWPFTEEYNSQGRIQKAEFIKHLRSHFNRDIELFLELSFRERNPVDLKAPEHIGKSVEYWVGDGITA